MSKQFCIHENNYVYTNTITSHTCYALQSTKMCFSQRVRHMFHNTRTVQGGWKFRLPGYQTTSTTSTISIGAGSSLGRTTSITLNTNCFTHCLHQFTTIFTINVDVLIHLSCKIQDQRCARAGQPWYKAQFVLPILQWVGCSSNASEGSLSRSDLEKVFCGEPFHWSPGLWNVILKTSWVLLFADQLYHHQHHGDHLHEHHSDQHHQHHGDHHHQHRGDHHGIWACAKEGGEA